MHDTTGDDTQATNVAIVAHSLLNSLAIVAGAVQTVVGHPDLDADARDRFLQEACLEVTRMGSVLKSLTSGSAAAALVTLSRALHPSAEAC